MYFVIGGMLDYKPDESEEKASWRQCDKRWVPTPGTPRQIPGYVRKALVASYKTNRGKMFCFCFRVIGFIL